MWNRLLRLDRFEPHLSRWLLFVGAIAIFGIPTWITRSAGWLVERFFELGLVAWIILGLVGGVCFLLVLGIGLAILGAYRIRRAAKAARERQPTQPVINPPTIELNAVSAAATTEPIGNSHAKSYPTIPETTLNLF